MNLRLISICGLAFICVPLLAQPLNERVLVVYNAASPESVDVANYYALRRAIPVSNLCAITSAAFFTVSPVEYATSIKTPVQSCLNSVGKQKILYIVVTYNTPLRIDYSGRRFSVDQYLADIWDSYTTGKFFTTPSATHSYYADAQPEGGWYPPYLSLANYRLSPKASLIYSVWRLDGPSAQLSKGLVDKAKAAEAAGGPAGQGCFDARLDPLAVPDIGYFNGEWDLYRSNQFVQQAGFATNFDIASAEMTSCPNAALYSGWYSLQYNDIFTWNTGAIGWHLDSASAANPRSGPYWVPGAISRGITVTTGSIDEPYLQGLVRPSGAFRNLLEGANVGDAFLRNTRWLKWFVLYFGDPLYTPFPGGRTPFNSGAATDTFFISNQRQIVGGMQQVTGTISLSSPAPAGGRTFSVRAYYGGGAAIVPSSVTVPATQASVSFPISGAFRTYALQDVIRATSGSLQLRNSIEVDPLLASVRTENTSIQGGQTLKGSVTLYARTPGSVTVSLSTNNPVVVVPPSVTVPPGFSGVTFTISTAPVVTDTDVKITAQYAGATATATLKVKP